MSMRESACTRLHCRRKQSRGEEGREGPGDTMGFLDPAVFVDGPTPDLSSHMKLLTTNTLELMIFPYTSA